MYTDAIPKSYAHGKQEEHLRVQEHNFGSFGVSPLCVTTVTSAHPCLGWLVLVGLVLVGLRPISF